MGEGSGADGFEPLGPHLYRVEPPDIVHIRLRGTVEGTHVDMLLDTIADVIASKRLYILRDAREGGSPSRSARELVVNDPRIGKLAALVTYGASFREKVMINMVDKAVRVLRPESPRILIFDAEAEARRFIDEDRKRRR